MNELNKPSLTALYLERRDRLKRFLMARLGNEAEAEDVVQDVFLKVDRLGSDPEINNPDAFLYRVAANVALDHIRKRQRGSLRDHHWYEAGGQSLAGEPVSPLPTAETAYAMKQRLAKLVKTVDELSPQCRKVFIMHKFDGLMHREISEKLGISKSTVEKHMNTALKYLTRKMIGFEEG